ncbi:uncharacterized protein ACNS7B_015265 [Menidia menidia]
MSENGVFCSEVKSIIEMLLKSSISMFGGTGEESASNEPEAECTTDFESIVEMLVREATRKIGCVFSQLSTLLLAENGSLKARVGQLEARLESTAESYENARLWRENVLSGCPVLFQQSGLVLTLKPCGTLRIKTHDPSEPSPADAQVEARHQTNGEETVAELPSPLATGPVSAEPSAASAPPAAVGVGGRGFECPVCGKSFSRRFHLTKHADSHREQQNPRRFGDAAGLESHLRRHEEAPPHGGERPHCCALCGKTFAGRRSLRTHAAVHRGKAFRCETCGAGFTLRQNLKRHARLHTGEKPYGCQVCGKRFPQAGRLKAHMLLHGAAKAFMCDLCGKTFLYNCQLKKHQQGVHADAEPLANRRRRRREPGSRRVVYRRNKTLVNMTPFSCPTCQRGFDSGRALRRHELVHAGNPQYSCPQCGKSFFYKATYEYHRRLHSGERPFGCDVCGKTFIVRQALKSHRLQHSGEKPHGCEQCGKAFRIYTNYLRHLRVHTGEKPYECEVCGARFRQLGHVKFHMQVHTKERPYPCSGCGRRFSDSRLLKRHSCG